MTAALAAMMMRNLRNFARVHNFAYR